MAEGRSAEIIALEQALDAVDRDARALVSGLSEQVGCWRADAASWSVAECFDHLAVSNDVYLNAMRPSAERALTTGRRRRRPALPGLIGRWFIRYLEPPVQPRTKGKNPPSTTPRPAVALSDAFSAFLASHEAVRAFVRRYEDIDLASVHFPNPFIRGVRFSLATGVHVLPAHERRHLWQAARTRAAAERALSLR